MTKREQIELYMKNLGLSEEEATQLWEDDRDDYIGEEGEAMQEKAKSIKNYTQAKATKERKPREQKPDEEKEYIISILAAALANAGITAEITNKSKSIDFKLDSAEFSVNLTRHRAKK